MRLLLIEDDAEAADFVTQGLAIENHEAEIVQNGRESVLRAARTGWDLLIVDRMLVGLGGLSVVRTLRASGVMTPVLFLTTMESLDDRATGLMPADFTKLAAWVAALARRSKRSAQSLMLRVDDLEMGLLARSVERAGRKVELQPREYLLLDYPMRSASQVMTCSMLLEHAWQGRSGIILNIVESNRSRLRGRIEQGRTPQGHTDQARVKYTRRVLIQAAPGAGYCIGQRESRQLWQVSADVCRSLSLII